MHCGDGFHGSNSVEIMNDSEPYEMARALDSDDDRPVGELMESDVDDRLFTLLVSYLFS